MAVSDLSGCAIFGTNVSTTVETVRPPHGLRLKADQSTSGHQTRLRAARGSKKVVLIVVKKTNLGELKALAMPSWLVRAFLLLGVQQGKHTTNNFHRFACHKLFSPVEMWKTFPSFVSS